MNRIEAIEILGRKMTELKTLPYEEFQSWQQKKHIEVSEIKSETGRHYQIEVQAILDDPEKLNGNIRVIASINDSHMLSLTRYEPVTREFVISPNNSIRSD